MAGAGPGRLARAAAPAVAAAGGVAAPFSWAGGTPPPRTKRKSSVLPQILACPGLGRALVGLVGRALVGADPQIHLHYYQ